MELTHMNDYKSDTAMRYVGGVAFALVIGLLSGCDDNKVNLPTSDSTPPTYKWTVMVKNEKSDAYEYTTSGQTLQLGKQYQYTVYFTVSDLDGGVRHVAWSGGGKTACPQSNQIDIAPISIAGIKDLSADDDGQVETVAALVSQIDASCRRLPGPLYPQSIEEKGGAITLKGAGNNYHAGSVTSILTIVSDP
jgi:hypothetical protein